jgi:nucleoside-diphosphate-sugar epimerase
MQPPFPPAGQADLVHLRPAIDAAAGAFDLAEATLDADEGWADLAECNAYAKSKLLAEKRAWELAADHGFELAVVHPGAIIGPPQQVKRESSTDIVRRMLAGEMPAVPPLHLAFTDVRDLAVVHRLALEVPEAKGNRYLCANGHRREGHPRARLDPPHAPPVGPRHRGNPHQRGHRPAEKKKTSVRW